MSPILIGNISDTEKLIKRKLIRKTVTNSKTLKILSNPTKQMYTKVKKHYPLSNFKDYFSTPLGDGLEADSKRQKLIRRRG